MATHSNDEARSAPTVSVIVPCYNQGRYLSDALNSLLAQTYRNWECIIVNDGSTDNTRQVALDYVSRDPRFRYLEQRNRGLANARNRGLREMRGTHVQFLDADDAIAPEKLQLQLEATASVAGLCVVYCDHYYASAEDLTKAIEVPFPMPQFVLAKPLWDIASRWETELSIPVHSFLFDARIFTDCGVRFYEGLPSHEDWDCWMQVFGLPVTLIHVPATLSVYRVHAQAITRDEYLMWKGFAAAIARQQQIWQADPAMSRLLSERMTRTTIRYGYSGNPFRNALVGLSRSVRFKQHVPWPVQKLVYRILGEKK